MATGDDQGTSGVTARVYEVSLHMLVRPAPPSIEALEEAAIAAAEAVEKYGADLVLAVASACEFEPPAIVLDMEIEATSSFEVHRRTDDVLRVLEQHLPVTVDGLSESSAPAERELIAS